MYRYFKTFTKNNLILISSWESKGLSNKKIRSTKTSSYDQSPRLVCDNARIKLNFSGDLLKQDKITYSHRPIVNIYVVYRLAPRTNNSDVTLENCLFGVVKLTNMLTLINTNILYMVLDLIQKDLFHIQVEDLAKMLLSLGLI